MDEENKEFVALKPRNVSVIAPEETGKTKWWIGCSGFSYKHWKETFYPKNVPQRKWFEYYCEHFNTVELNGTFYRFPRLPYVQGWYDRSPEAFKFSVKAPRAITHFKQFHDSTKFLTDFYGTIREGLKTKLGCVLFQLPPRTCYTEERLQRILENLDPSFQNVLEFRDSSWWTPDVYLALANAGVIFCGMSHPDLPQKIIHDAPTLYYRFHGIPYLYKSPYQIPQLEGFVHEVAEGKTTTDAFIYFNNDIDASAIVNAQQLQSLTA